MAMSKRMKALSLSTIITLSSVGYAFADSARVVTLGADLTESQKSTMLKYFGVNKDETVLLEVNNQEERKYLEGVATESQLGKKTYSCAYVEPTKKGSGINVKTANLTWLTSSMVASTLATTGMTDADVVVASVFPVSGTGAMAGIMKAFEDATGEALDETKKEIASEELIITGGLGEDIGADKATGIVNEIKTEIIKNNTQDTTQIAQTINNVVNNYNVTINASQQKDLEALMQKISKQDYDYKEMKNTLNSIQDTVEEKLDAIGEGIDRGFFENIANSIKGWFSDLGDWISGIFKNKEDELGILGSTDDSLLGNNAIIDATNEDAINLPSAEKVEGFFAKIWNWFTNLFKGNDSEKIDNEEQINSDVNTNPDDALIESMEQNSTLEENIEVENTETDNKEESMNEVETPSNDEVSNTEDNVHTETENTNGNQDVADGELSSN